MPDPQAPNPILLTAGWLAERPVASQGHGQAPAHPCIAPDQPLKAESSSQTTFNSSHLSNQGQAEGTRMPDPDP